MIQTQAITWHTMKKPTTERTNLSTAELMVDLLSITFAIYSLFLATLSSLSIRSSLMILTMRTNFARYTMLEASVVKDCVMRSYGSVMMRSHQNQNLRY